MFETWSFFEPLSALSSLRNAMVFNDEVAEAKEIHKLYKLSQKSILNQLKLDFLRKHCLHKHYS